MRFHVLSAVLLATLAYPLTAQERRGIPLSLLVSGFEAGEQPPTATLPAPGTPPTLTVP